MNKLRGGMAVAAFALSARSSGSLSVPSPVIRQGRALSESLLGIRLNMSRWQIFRTLFLSAMSVLVVGFATMTYHMPLMQKISEFHNRMPGLSTALHIPLRALAWASAATASSVLSRLFHLV